MSLPTLAERSIEISAPPELVYDLVSDVTRMGEWSPECVSCEWQGDAGQVGTRFRGRNRRGLMRWSTVAEVLVAERPHTFGFATMLGDKVGTKWTYRIEGAGDSTTLSESFEAVFAPKLITFVERIFIRNRQEQLEEGITRTLEAIKVVAERSASGSSTSAT